MQYHGYQPCNGCGRDVGIQCDGGPTSFRFEDHYRSDENRTLCPNSGQRMTPTKLVSGTHPVTSFKSRSDRTFPKRTSVHA
jgi:hypothetical protein